MYSENFKEFVDIVLKKSLDASNIKEAFNILALAIAERYRETQVYFAEKFTTRISYVAGAGEESLKPSEKIKLDDKYFVFLQNFNNVPESDKDIIISLCKIVTSIKSI